jgi:hypothetical protein
LSRGSTWDSTHASSSPRFEITGATPSCWGFNAPLLPNRDIPRGRGHFYFLRGITLATFDARHTAGRTEVPARRDRPRQVVGFTPGSPP